MNEFQIRAIDNGTPPKAQTIRVSINVVSVPEDSPHPPVVKTSTQTIKVTESDKVGFLVSLIQATDEDNDTLWFDIIGESLFAFNIFNIQYLYHIGFIKKSIFCLLGGNENNDFFIGSEKGNVHLAKKLMWETKSSYALNISVTDGVHKIYTQVYKISLFFYQRFFLS